MISIPKNFSMGQIVATPAALEAIELFGPESRRFSLRRHAAQDWGDLDERTSDSMTKQCRTAVGSCPPTPPATSTKLWIITTAEDSSGQRAATTILLPHQY